MSKLIVTNIRLPKAEIQRYRQLAHAEERSLSQFIRAVVGQYTHQLQVGGKADVCRIAVQHPQGGWAHLAASANAQKRGDHQSMKKYHI